MPRTRLLNFVLLQRTTYTIAGQGVEMSAESTGSKKMYHVLGDSTILNKTRCVVHIKSWCEVMCAMMGD